MFGLNAADINTVIFTSLTSAIITGVIVYLIQKSIENSFTKKMEEFRASIQYSLFEQQTKFARTYQKRIETLEVLHEKIIILWRNLHSLANLIRKRIATPSIMKKDEEKEYDELAEIVSTSYFDFLHFFTENRVYLPDQSIEEIDRINTKIGALWMLLNLSLGIEVAPPEVVSWANHGIKKFGLDIKKINPKKPNASLFVDQIMSEMENQKEIFEKHYKSLATDDSENISKGNSRK